MTTEEKILTSALKLFVSKGFGTTTAAITADAGVSSGILFHYFSTKADLILFLYSNIQLEYYQAGTLIIESNDISEFIDFENNIKKAWKAQIEWGLEHWEKFLFLQLFENSPFMDQYEPQNNPKIQELETYIIKQTEIAIDKHFLKNLPVKLIINNGKALTISTMKFLHENQEKNLHQELLEEAWKIYNCAMKR